MKQTWQQINNIIKPTRGKHVKINLYDGDALIDDNGEVLNVFNNYFAWVGRKLNMNIPQNNKKSFFFSLVYFKGKKRNKILQDY